MTDKILKLIEKSHPLTEKSVGGFSTFKAKGMTFTCKAYDAQGLGHVSVMRAKGFFGLMKMDTLIIAPVEKDLPLLSYDRIYAMGNDTLILELYDTMGAEKADLLPIARVNEKYAYLTDRFGAGEEPSHWYDSIRLPETVSKKGKVKQHELEFNAFTLSFIEAFLGCEANGCQAKEKLARTELYAEGLINNGGPATDVFKKEFGEEKTSNIIHKVLFGTK